MNRTYFLLDKKMQMKIEKRNANALTIRFSGQHMAAAELKTDTQHNEEQDS